MIDGRQLAILLDIALVLLLIWAALRLISDEMRDR